MIRQANGTAHPLSCRSVFMTRSPAPPTFTLGGCLDGVRYVLPILPGICVFASAFGTAAAQKELTLSQALAMSAFVYAGASQMVALELWRETWSLSAILAVMTVTATVNARMVLMGAAIQPWLAIAPPAQNAINLFFLTDANWLIGMRYRAEGGADLGVMFGAGLVLWVVWIAATLPGFLAGALVSEPARYGIDLVMPIFFSAMIVPLWRGVRSTLPWVVAGAVALTVEALLPGYLFIVAGALAGAFTGALLKEPHG
jgi:predicted branched-subunit amino acid permease